MVAFDYGLGRDETGATGAGMMTRKGPRDLYVVRACTEFVLSLGYASAVVQTDGKPAMREMMAPLRGRPHLSIPQSCRGYSPANSLFCAHLGSSTNHVLDNPFRMNPLLLLG